jgi:hypothetical protein
VRRGRPHGGRRRPARGGGGRGDVSGHGPLPRRGVDRRGRRGGGRGAPPGGPRHGHRTVSGRDCRTGACARTGTGARRGVARPAVWGCGHGRGRRRGGGDRDCGSGRRFHTARLDPRVTGRCGSGGRSRRLRAGFHGRRPAGGRRRRRRNGRRHHRRGCRRDGGGRRRGSTRDRGRRDGSGRRRRRGSGHRSSRRRRRRNGRRERARGDGRLRRGSGCGDGRRNGCRRGRGSGRRRGRAASRQQTERVDVAVLVARVADAEVEVGLPDLGGVGRADRAHLRALPHLVALCDGDRAEVREGDDVAVCGRDRHDQAVARDLAGERHGSRRRGAGRLARLAADVDAAVLPAGVGVGAEPEGPQHRPARRPGPRVRGGGSQQREREDDQAEQPAHEHLLVLDLDNRGKRLARRSDGVNRGNAERALAPGTDFAARSGRDARVAPTCVGARRDWSPGAKGRARRQPSARGRRGRDPRRTERRVEERAAGASRERGTSSTAARAPPPRSIPLASPGPTRATR